MTPGNVGEEDEGVGLGGNGAGGGHFVGVDVVVLAVKAEGDGTDDGDGSHGPDGVEPFGICGGDFADVAEIGHGLLLAGAEDMAVAAGEADGFGTALDQGGYKRLVDAATEDHEGGVAGFSVGDAEAGDELGLFAHLGEEPGELDASAVDQGHAVAIFGQLGDGAGAVGEDGWVFQGRSSEFDYELHGFTSCLWCWVLGRLQRYVRQVAP